MFSRKLKEDSDFEAIDFGDNLLTSAPKIEVPERFSSNPNTSFPISPTLVRSICEGKSFDEPPKILSREELNGIINEALVRMPNHPFHNRTHIEKVLKKLEVILESGVTIRDESGERRDIVEWEKQALLIACAFHDMGHSGTQYRQLSSDVSLKEGRLFSNEEHAAILADEVALRLDLSLSQRLTIQGLILGTTYGQRSLELLPDAVRHDQIAQSVIRDYHPVTDLERLVSYLDVASFDKEVDDFLEDNINAFLENDPSDIPLTEERWAAKTYSFLNFLETRLLLLEEVLSREAFDSQLRGIRELRGEILRGNYAERVLGRMKERV